MKTLKPPKTLTPDAQARWRAVVPILTGRVDRDVLATYCQVWVRWRKAEDGLAQSGQLIRSANGRVVASPLIRIAKDAAAQVRALEGQIGLAEPVTGMSIREFAKLVGVSHTAIGKGIKAGRLKQSLGRSASGQPVIADVPLAQSEWMLTSRTAKGAQQTADVVPNNTLVEAQRSATMERARKLKIENDVSDGRLVLVDTVKKEAFEAARVIREQLINVTARIAGELAAESDPSRVYIKLDAAIREALNAGADALLATAANV